MSSAQPPGGQRVRSSVARGNALRLSRWPGPQVHDALGRIWWRVAEPGPRADDALRMLERIDEVTGDRAAFNLPADGASALAPSTARLAYWMGSSRARSVPWPRTSSRHVRRLDERYASSDGSTGRGTGAALLRCGRNRDPLAAHGLHPVSLPGPGRPGQGQLTGQARPGRLLLTHARSGTRLPVSSAARAGGYA